MGLPLRFGDARCFCALDRLAFEVWRKLCCACVCLACVMLRLLADGSSRNLKAAQKPLIFNHPPTLLLRGGTSFARVPPNAFACHALVCCMTGVHCSLCQEVPARGLSGDLNEEAAEEQLE